MHDVLARVGYWRLVNADYMNEILEGILMKGERAGGRALHVCLSTHACEWQRSSHLDPFHAKLLVTVVCVRVALVALGACWSHSIVAEYQWSWKAISATELVKRYAHMHAPPHPHPRSGTANVCSMTRTCASFLSLSLLSLLLYGACCCA
jgi:hypothetical protein